MAADNAYDNAADPAYSHGWFLGSNGGYGFGPWGLGGWAGGEDRQFTIASSPGIDVSNKSWAVTVLTSSYVGAYRPFAGGNLSPGQVLRFSWTFPGTNAWDSHILLVDSGNNQLVSFGWTSGSFSFATNNVWDTASAAPWATSGSSATASFSLTDDDTMYIKIVSGTNSVVFDGVTITSGISAVGLYTSGPTDTNLPGMVAYFNELSVADQARIPIMNPAGGPLTNGQLVSISTATPGASIRYTLDGSEPSPTTGLVYSAPLLLNPVRPIRVRAMAYKAGLVDSPVARTTYAPQPPPPPLGMAVGNNLSQVVAWD
ncbi:MAG: chitobiase/beta-hexosaminidase C-terminal domain-containing protein [Verrucomicrobia bacterium]|nr:chitobiase/beta-hexosaminidase C-terminal domain-containing protein [Verrucomicrobiota bacterium]